MDVENLQFIHNVLQGIIKEGSDNQRLLFYARDGVRIVEALARCSEMEFELFDYIAFSDVKGLEVYQAATQVNHCVTANIGEFRQNCCYRLSKILRFVTECSIGTVNPAVCALQA